jgi:hypothetical protein
LPRYAIKDWKTFQHFKDRTPPWIKLYRHLLDDPDWHALDGDASKLLVMLWLIASEDETHSGLLPDERKLAFRLRISETKLIQSLNKLSHWLIQDDIKTISTRYLDDAPETETETETETEFDSLRESSSPTAKTIPPCPVQKILDTYHRVLPTLTRVVAMNDTRRKMLSTRWRELYEAGDFETQDGGVETFESYFLMVKDSQFLMGKANGANGRKPFMADFEWLIRPQNFLKVIEGKYHGNA